MRTIALAALFLAGCAGPVPVYLQTFDAAPGPITAPSPRVREVLDEGFGVWGLEYELVRPEARLRSYGAVDLTIVDLAHGVDARVGGSAYQPAPCRPRVGVDADGRLLAHELGHVWGLEHVEDPANLMFFRAGDPGEITDEQYETVDREVSLLLACIDGA